MQSDTQRQQNANSQEKEEEYEIKARQSYQWQASVAERDTSASKYHDIHAFNRKRTLANQFFNEKQITKKNNKSFASGLRGGSKLKQAGGQHSRSPEGPSKLEKKSNSPVRKHLNDQTGEIANIMGSTQLTASTQPYVEHVVNQNQGRWANIDQASVQARISVETSQGSQSNMPIHRVPNVRPKFTMADDQQKANQDNLQILNPNASMSVMSLKAPGQASYSNRGYHQSQQPFPSSPGAKNNIQNVTITQKMHGGALNPSQFGQRQSNKNLHPSGKKKDLSLKNATVEQRLEHFARISQGDYNDDASRFVNFQGGQIGAGNLKMSFLGDETSSKNVTFYGGVNQSAISKYNSNQPPQINVKGNQQFKSGAVNLKQPNGAVDGLAGSTSRGDFPATNDFEELNKLIDGDVSQTKFDIIFGGSKGPNATAQSPSSTKKNFQIFPKDPAYDANFGRRGTQKLEEESFQGLRVGSRILADAVQGVRGDKSSMNDGVTPVRTDHVSPNFSTKQLQQITLPKIDQTHSSKFDTKGPGNLESQEFKFNKKSNNPQVNVGNVFASQSTERTKTAGRPEEGGKGFPNPMLTSTQKYDQLQDMVKDSTLAALPQNDEYDVKSPLKDPNKTSKINLIADEADTENATQPKSTLFELNQVQLGPAPMPPGRMHQMSSEYTRQINTGVVNSEINAAQTISPHLSDGGQHIKLDQILKQQTSASPMNDSFHNDNKKESTAEQGVSPIGLSQFNSPNDPRIPYPGGGSEPHLGLGNSNDISHVGVSPDIPFRKEDQQFSEIVNLQHPNSNKNQYQVTEGTMINSPMSGKPIRINNVNTRLAVSIGHPSQMKYAQEMSRQQSLQHQPSKETISKNDDQLPIDVSGAVSQNHAQAFEDGEQAILVQILEKMLKKHSVTKDQHKVKYQSNRIKPNIEDKLRSLDIFSEMAVQDFEKNYRKDYCKLLKDHIQEIIKTGRQAKLGTQTAYLEKKLITDGKEANLLIKLQQLKTAQSKMQIMDNSSSVFNQGSPLPQITGAEYALYNLNQQQNMSKKIDFNDLKSISNYNVQSNKGLVKQNATSPDNDYDPEEMQGKALNAHPKHSQSVSPNHMLTGRDISPPRQVKQSQLQTVNSQFNINSQNVMFQSNQMIDTIKNHPIKGSAQKIGGQTFVSQMGSSVDSLHGQAVPKNSKDKLNEWTESKSKDLTVVSESNHQQDNNYNNNNQENYHESSLLSNNNQQFQQQYALSSADEYHSQYNRLENIIKFNLPVVTRRHLLQGPHDTSNVRLNEIHAKLRDPNGHMQLMERNAIVKNKFKSSNASRNKNQSFSTISIAGGPSQAELLNSLKYLPHDHLLSKNLVKSLTNQQQFSPPRFSGSQLQLAQKPSVFSQMVSPSFARTGGFGLEDHPLSDKVNEFKELHQKEFKSDPDNVNYKRQLLITQQQEKQKATNKRPKISDWLQKDVMLPILGKNKTSMFHSIDQLEVENIAHQRPLENKSIRNTLQSYKYPATDSRKQSQFGFRRKRKGENLETDCSHAPKNLKQILKQQEKEASDLANQQEKHLMSQLRKVAEQMAGPENLPQIQVENFDNTQISIKVQKSQQDKALAIQENLTPVNKR